LVLITYDIQYLDLTASQSERLTPVACLYIHSYIRIRWSITGT